MINWSLIDCDHGASLCRRKLWLLFLCLFSFIWNPHPFLSLCLYVCHPHPIPTLSQVSTSFPQPCTVTMATSGLWRHSAAVAQCFCPYSLSFSHSLCLSFSLFLLRLAGYEWIKQLCVNLQCSFDCPFFLLFHSDLCSFFWCYFSSDLGLFTACVYKTWQTMTISKTKYYFRISYGS